MTAELAIAQLGGLEVLRGVLNPGVAEEPRTRGLAIPAFCRVCIDRLASGSNLGLRNGAVSLPAHASRLVTGRLNSRIGSASQPELKWRFGLPSGLERTL
jgi:hypothetical protein